MPFRASHFFYPRFHPPSLSIDVWVCVWYICIIEMVFKVHWEALFVLASNSLIRPFSLLPQPASAHLSFSPCRLCLPRCLP